MIMRVTTAYSYEAGVEMLQKRQREMAEKQEQLTSGKRVSRASDDPTSAARAERAAAVVARSEANQRALEASRNAMELTEGALADGTDLLQQAREVLVAAGNASYTDAERAGLARRLESLRTQLMSVANRSDGAGGYLFAGQGAGQAPFLDAPGGVVYRGTSGSVQTASEEVLPLTVDGEASWLHARTGNGVFATSSAPDNGAWIDGGRVSEPSLLTGQPYQLTLSVVGDVTTYSVVRNGDTTVATGMPYKSGQSIEVEGMAFTITGTPKDGDTFDIVPSEPELSVFDVFDRAIEELSTPLRTAAQVTQGAQRALRDLDASSNALQALRSTVGEALNRVDAVEGRVSALKLYGKAEQSAAEDLDMVEAISDFTEKQNGYNAALQSYSMVQRMSLMQYLQV